MDNLTHDDRSRLRPSSSTAARPANANGMDEPVAVVPEKSQPVADVDGSSPPLSPFVSRFGSPPGFPPDSQPGSRALPTFVTSARRWALSLWDTEGLPGVRAPVGAQTPRRAMRVARVLFLVILCVNLLGLCGLWVLDSVSIAQRATTDLSIHLARIESMLGTGTPQLGQLGELKSEMAAAEIDLRSLDGLLPLGGMLPVGQEAAAHHALRLGIDALDAGQQAIMAGTVLAPTMVALVSTVIHGAQSPLPPGSHLFTVQDQGPAQVAINSAIASWSAAQADRQQLSASDLDLLHNRQLSAFVTRFDKLAPNVTLVLQVAKQLLDPAPRLLGIEKPEHILLLNMDTDELRATGGFLGNYADLEFAHGALVSGVHLHDVYTLDCPNNQCPNRPVPPDDSWFTIARGKFAMRDSNLDPDFPTSAWAIEQLYQQESGTQVDGMIAITPAVVASILRVTGPVTVPRFQVSVTADNLRDLLHYYHQNSQIALQLGISPSALGTSIFKVFDVLAAQAVLAKLQALTSAQQVALAKALLQDLTTKDIQFFSNIQHLQDLVVANGVGGHVAVAPFDSLAVVDTNDGATYANADIRESLVDQVTLDAGGGAAHALSVTYAFPVVAHNYAQQNHYADFVRVIVPNNAVKPAVSGPCTPLPAKQSFHVVLACQFSLARGGSATLHFSWSVPNPNSAQGTALPYSLLVARQPGASVQMQITIAPPTGAAFAPSAGPGSITHGQLAWSAHPLTSDVTIKAPLQGK